MPATDAGAVPPDRTARASTWPLLALAVGAFGIGTTEFAPMGLLPTIATGVGVSIPTAGLLVSAYAVGVMLGAPAMTLALGRLRRRQPVLSPTMRTTPASSRANRCSSSGLGHPGRAARGDRPSVDSQPTLHPVQPQQRHCSCPLLCRNYGQYTT